MPDKKIYALNTVSGAVSKIDADLLKHPAFSAILVEVDQPDACISCGEQPDSVTTTAGDEIILATPEPVSPVEPEPKPKPAPRARKTATKEAQ